MAPQNMPPRMPAGIISDPDRESFDIVEDKGATPVAKMAPMMYWPSAPIFQTLARKPSDSPTRDHDERRCLDEEFRKAALAVSGSMPHDAKRFQRVPAEHRRR